MASPLAYVTHKLLRVALSMASPLAYVTHKLLRVPLSMGSPLMYVTHTHDYVCPSPWVIQIPFNIIIIIINKLSFNGATNKVNSSTQLHLKCVRNTIRNNISHYLCSCVRVFSATVRHTQLTPYLLGSCPWLLFYGDLSTVHPGVCLQEMCRQTASKLLYRAHLLWGQEKRNVH